jgi:hypothetical protein
MYSLRPECIRLAATGAGNPSEDAVAHFRGRIVNQTFGGAMDVLEIDCGNSQILRARAPNPGPLAGEHEFEFTASDAIELRDEGGQ